VDRLRRRVGGPTHLGGRANLDTVRVESAATGGRFTADGHGEFYDHEELDGRRILVRYVWSEIMPTSAHFEQAFSLDDGATWETNWITDQTRITDPATE
jgi:hypothetical protein